MTIYRRRLLELAMLAPLSACTPAVNDPRDDSGNDPGNDPIATAMRRIQPLFLRKLPPRPGDWLAEHKEAGQTYREFRATVKARAIDAYSRLRIVPIGPLTAGQDSVLSVVTDIMRPFFGLPLEMDPPVALDNIPADAQRIQYYQGPKQLLTTYLLNTTLMARRRPGDAAVLGITAIDLWPGPGWNFVFGQASLRERVGVWSMARNGNPDDRPAMRKLCAIRTAMTATHETGHMFGIRHCIAYECGMNGSNHSEERDRQPFEFCPECQAKLWWTLGLDPLARSRALGEITRKHEFEGTAAHFARQSAALEKPAN
jgi:archaemetzincin